MHVHMGLALHVQMGSAQTLSSKHQWAGRTSVPRLWKRRHSPWYWGVSRQQRRQIAINAKSPKSGRVLSSTKGTRSVLSMTVPGAEPMLICRKANSEERTTAPTVMDCLHGIHWLQAAQDEPPKSKLPYAHWDWPSKKDEWLLLKADVTKDHRQIKILPEEWKYQVARLSDEWCVNKVGTYGMASAQIYWGRMAALLLRLVYHTFPLADWALLFLLLVEEAHGGTPHSRHLAVHGGLWLPSQLEEDRHRVLQHMAGVHCYPPRATVSQFRMAPTKHELVMAVLAKMMANEVFTRTELDSALGRLQWATNCCHLTKPFLQAF